MSVSPGLIERIVKSQAVVFFTGAGVSAESGIPVFRGKDGIWNKLKPEELANFDAFMRNPDMVWEWYNHRRQIVQHSKPNPGHLAIAELERLLPEVSVITQNVDNLHRRAGSSKVYELHGNIERSYCVKCGAKYKDEPDFSAGVPKCRCGGLVRPDVVWFGEVLPIDQFTASEKAAENCDVFFIVGTSAIVYPAASLIYVAKDSGAFLVEVNVQTTEITSIADESIFGKAGEILPAITGEVAKILN